MEVSKLSIEDLKKVLRGIVDGTGTIFYNTNSVVSAILNKCESSEVPYLYIYESNCDIHLKDAASELFWNKHVAKYITGVHSLKGVEHNHNLHVIYPVLYCSSKQKWIDMAKSRILSSKLSGEHLEKFKSEYPELFEQMCYNTFKRLSIETLKSVCTGSEIWINDFYNIASDFWKESIKSKLYDYIANGKNFELINVIRNCSPNYGCSLRFMEEEFVIMATKRFLETNPHTDNLRDFMQHYYDSVFYLIVEYKKKKQSEVSVYADILNHCSYRGFDKTSHLYPRVRKAIEFIVRNYSPKDYELAKQFAIDPSAFECPTVRNSCIYDYEISFFDELYTLSQAILSEFTFDKFVKEMADLAHRYNGSSNDVKVLHLADVKKKLDTHIELLKNKKSWKQK